MDAWCEAGRVEEAQRLARQYEPSLQLSGAIYNAHPAGGLRARAASACGRVVGVPRRC